MEKKLEKKVCSRADYVNRKIKWIKEDFDILTNSDRLCLESY